MYGEIVKILKSDSLNVFPGITKNLMGKSHDLPIKAVLIINVQYAASHPTVWTGHKGHYS